MKRKIAAFLAGAVLLGLGGCKPAPAPNGGTPTTDPTTATTTQAPLADKYDWANDLPRMDGSTSTIPLEAGLRAALFGISQAEAELTVSHTTTYGSFENLINGKCDLIFSVPMSDDQIAQAADKGMELEMTKIAAEGFVFVVNAKNPVDTLTQQQLKDIYSGKITNWKEVGGNDAPITAYQRNETSGSQNFMHTFMGDTPLMSPLTDFTPSTMGMLMDAIAVYDNAENAIGYSVYAYAADMYGNGNEIKFIQVDGVAPSKATMADGSYPLLGYNYAVYDKKTPVDSPLRQFVNWIASEEGQRAVKAAGYVPILPVGDLPETTIRLYTAVGTGPEKPADFEPAIYQYVASVLDKDIDGNDRSQVLIDAIKDEITRKMVQDFVEESRTTLEAKPRETTVSVFCINGYLQVQVSHNADHTKPTQAALFDLVAGKRLISSDLFFKGVDFVTVLNAAIREAWVYSPEGGVGTVELKRDFAGLPAENIIFGISTVSFEVGNPYTTTPVIFKTDMLYEFSVRSLPRDMSGLFDDSVRVYKSFVNLTPYVDLEKLVLDHFSAEVLKANHYPVDIAEKINNAVRDCCENELSLKSANTWSKVALQKTFANGGHANVCLKMLGTRFVYLDAYVQLFEKGKLDGYTYGAVHFYDMTTGEEIPYTTFLKDGWETAGSWTDNGALNEDYEKSPIERPDLADAKLISFKGRTLTFAFADPELPYAEVKVPAEYINWDA